MEGWFAQTPLLDALGGVIAIGILIYMLVVITRNVDDDLPRAELAREADHSTTHRRHIRNQNDITIRSFSLLDRSHR